jgi:hypothetical protein
MSAQRTLGNILTSARVMLLAAIAAVMTSTCRLPRLPQPDPRLRPVCSDSLRAVDACPSRRPP